MGRRRKAWLYNKTGRRFIGSRLLPGYYAGYYEYASLGHRINHTKHFLTQSSARRWVRQYNARLDLRQLNEIVPIELDEASRQFLQRCTALASATQTHYKSALVFLTSRQGRNRFISQIDGSAIDDLVAWRLCYSEPATVAKHVRSLRRFFNWCRQQGYCEANPVHLATSLPRDRIVRDRPQVSDQQLAHIAQALTTADRRLAFWLALTTGLDRRMIEQLTGEQVDLQDHTIRASRRKTGRPVTAPLHAALVPQLAASCARTRPGAALLRGLSRQSRETDWWQQAVKAAGVPRLLFRDLRALATVRLCRVPGVTLAHAQQLLGHSSPETTARHYLPCDPTIRAAIDVLPLPGARRPAKATKRPRASSGAPQSKRRRARRA